MDKKIFWSDDAQRRKVYQGDERFRGGLYFRAFDLIKFMKLVEKEEGEVVGLCFEGNNVDVIIREHDNK